MQLGNTPIQVQNGQPDRPVVVIAKNYIQFRNWCQKKEINHNSPLVFFVWEPRQLFRVVAASQAWYVDLGFYSRDPDAYGEFYALRAARGMHEIPSDA